MHSNHDTDSQQQYDADTAAKDGTYSIGEVAKMIGSTIKTVRYYDEIGLVKPTSYTEGGHRLYTTEDIWCLELIASLRYLDFGIEEISQVISSISPCISAIMAEMPKPTSSPRCDLFRANRNQPSIRKLIITDNISKNLITNEPPHLQLLLLSSSKYSASCKRTFIPFFSVHQRARPNRRRLAGNTKKAESSCCTTRL